MIRIASGTSTRTHPESDPAGTGFGAATGAGRTGGGGGSVRSTGTGATLAANAIAGFVISIASGSGPLAVCSAHSTTNGA